MKIFNYNWWLIILVIIAAIKSTVRHKVGYVLFLVLFFSFANMPYMR